MFYYRPSKDMCWGHALRPKDPVKQAQKMDAFFTTYFEPHDPSPAAVMGGTVELQWKQSVLPNLDWPAEFLKPENQQSQRVSMMLMFDRISFVMGLHIPISSTEASSYEFLARFSADAPFKMSAKYFSVAIPTAKKGKVKFRRADAEILRRLQEVIE